MSIENSYWEEALWKTIYTVAYTFPDHPASQYQEYTDMWYQITGQLLPCEEFREYFCDYLDQYPIENSSTDRKSLLHWVNSLENYVNKQLKKPPVSLETRIAEIDRLTATKPVTVSSHQQRASTKPKSVPSKERQHASTKPEPVTPQPSKEHQRRAGTISYGMRRGINTLMVPVPVPEPDSNSKTESEQAENHSQQRTRNTVSYGMRRSSINHKNYYINKQAPLPKKS